MGKVQLTKSVLFKCTLLFALFTVSILLITGMTTYYSETQIYQKQNGSYVRNVGDYLAASMKAEGINIRTYQEYYMAHCKEADIPYDFDEYTTARTKFETMFAAAYPGKVLGKDVAFEQMSPELQMAWFIYVHEYWLLNFERARESFGLPYTYYLFMKEDVHDVVYLIDGERTRREDNPDLLYLGDTYHNDEFDYAVMWKTWSTGLRQDGFKEFDNSWGHTLGYYTPLIIDGEKLGLVVAEIDVSQARQEIIGNAMEQLFCVGVVVAVGMLMMLMLLNASFIRRARQLEKRMTEYTAAKDSALADQIERDFAGGDEVSSLGIQFAAMIRELESHMNNIARISHDLEETHSNAAVMDDLMNKDSMTGVRNRTAFEKEIHRVEKNCREGGAAFGMALVNINDLKDINEEYGHEKGDLAVVRLCRIICRIFSHSAVFRTGGDEFSIILMNEDCRYAESLIIEFGRTLGEAANDTSLEEWQRVNAAIGYSMFNPREDESFGDAIARARNAMYENKQRMKQMRKR